jgi:tetratricopeptide (TPR) repeat protein
MKPALFVACAALLAAPFASQAADTPSTPAVVKIPSVADRLAGARRALDAKNYDVAMRELTAAEKEDPRNADVHNLLGYTWRKRPQPDLVKAIAHYQTALKINPQHRGVHEYIGEAYLMDRKPAEAEKHLAELEKICGKGCEEYQDLAKSIAAYKAKAGG